MSLPLPLVLILLSPSLPQAELRQAQAELSRSRATQGTAEEDNSQLLEQMQLLKQEVERSRHAAAEAQQVAALTTADAELARWAGRSGCDVLSAKVEGCTERHIAHVSSWTATVWGAYRRVSVVTLQ